MTKSNRLQVGWHIYIGAKCPECGHDLYFRQDHPRTTASRKVVYCPQQSCIIHGELFLLDMTDGEVKEIDL